MSAGALLVTGESSLVGASLHPPPGQAGGEAGQEPGEQQGVQGSSGLQTSCSLCQVGKNCLNKLLTSAAPIAMMLLLM